MLVNAKGKLSGRNKILVGLIRYESQEWMGF